MWSEGWRDAVWSSLGTTWDLVIVGGGITGAGVLREAVRLGLHALLLEQDDFASGTSSRSSKQVHGGLRYLIRGQVKTTWEAVHERERLLREQNGLVLPLCWLMTNYYEQHIPTWAIGVFLAMYDLIGGKWAHRRLAPGELLDQCKPLTPEGLAGGYTFIDGQVDDAWLVLRVLADAVRAGGVALNYARVTGLLRDRSGKVSGVMVEDRQAGHAGKRFELKAKCVINAGGAWSDQLRQQVGGAPRLRPVRGSHIVFPLERLPLPCAVALVHPRDGKRLFAFPWENIAMIGTTNHDHTSDLDEEPCASLDEREYLLELAQWAFPCQELVQSDVQATYAGVRPVVNTGRKDPGMESREHVIWRENGLLTVSGGKLTTFRLMAYQALRLALPERADDLRQLERQPEGVLDRLPQGIDFPAGVDETMQVRLLGRYGADLSGFLNDARPEELSPIDNTTFYWAELRWAARHGAVQRLSDLLFRRVRLGLLLSRGGLHHLARIRSIVQAELGWDDLRWQAEQSAYEQLWQECYAW